MPSESQVDLEDAEGARYCTVIRLTRYKGLVDALGNAGPALSGREIVQVRHFVPFRAIRGTYPTFLARRAASEVVSVLHYVAVCNIPGSYPTPQALPNSV